MPPRVPRHRLMTVAEYLAFEHASPVRHEFVGGRVYAMVGVARPHSRITMNVAARLWMAARGGPCRVHHSEVRLQVGDEYYYPDVMVACGPEPDDPHVEDAPCLAVEVLSASSRRTDLREKPLAYGRVASLRLYLVVDQRRRLVDRYWRDDAGPWRHDTVAGQGAVELPCPRLTLTLDEIYEGVDLAAVPPRRVRERATAYGERRAADAR
jgi:Uma2 family endonuclease